MTWAWTGPGEPPGFRLLRRLRTHPVDPDEGYVVVDSSELFEGPDEPWERVCRVRYVVEDGSTEGGLVSATLALFHDVPGASVPVRVDLELRGPAGDPLASRRIEDVTRVERTLMSEGDTRAIEIFHAPDGLVERSVGRVTGGGTSLRWEPVGAPPVEVAFDRAALWQTRAEVRKPSDAERLVVWLRSLRMDSSDLANALSDPDEAPPSTQLRTALVTLREELSAPGGEWTRSFRVSDLAVPAEGTSCYALFVEDPASPTGWITERGWKASASGAAPLGFDDPMLGGLPSVRHFVDVPAREDRGTRPHGSLGSPAWRSTR